MLFFQCLRACSRPIFCQKSGRKVSHKKYQLTTIFSGFFFIVGVVLLFECEVRCGYKCTLYFLVVRRRVIFTNRTILNIGIIVDLSTQSVTHPQRKSEILSCKAISHFSLIPPLSFDILKTDNFCQFNHQNL